ncbi:MAG TPA: helix-turn-helix transcriptional regulator, partial [Tepidisphaeraceae bacterium]|nr:helix-turn-helix transcriptional regulator [Tepidisphaeraceae bacterium]
MADVLEIKGQRYYLLDEDEFHRLRRGGKSWSPLPALPEPDGEGNVPAVAYIRATLARRFATARRHASLTQAALAKLAGVRVETINRLERGRHTPDPATVDKIERALKRARQGRR